jgi:hypothetical protein
VASYCGTTKSSHISLFVENEILRVNEPPYITNTIYKPGSKLLSSCMKCFVISNAFILLYVMYLSYTTRTLATHGTSKHEIKTSGLQDVPLCPMANIHISKDRSRFRTSRTICAKTRRNCMEDVNSHCVCFFQGFPRRISHATLQGYCTNLHVYIRGDCHILNMDLL